METTGKKSIKTWIGKLTQIRELSLILVLLLVGAVLSVATDTFLGIDNLMNIIRQVTLVAIIACSQTYVITTGGIDLSVGYNLGLASIVMCTLINFGVPLPIAMLGAVVSGTFVGFMNGLLITKLALPPFIITLGMQYIAKGLINVITEGYAILIDAPFVMKLGQGSFGPVPIMVVFLIIIGLMLNYIYRNTVFSNSVKAVGGNEAAAKLSGINVNRVKQMVYALNGLVCGIVGIIITGRLNSGNPNAGVNFDMNSVAAVIIGGTSLAGGSGTVIGSILGALLLAVIRNGLTLLRVNMYWETVATGSIIIAVCALDSLTSRKRR